MWLWVYPWQGLWTHRVPSGVGDGPGVHRDCNGVCGCVWGGCRQTWLQVCSATFHILNSIFYIPYSIFYVLCFILCICIFYILYDDDFLLLWLLKKLCSNCVWDSLVFSYLALHSEWRCLRCLSFCRWWKLKNIHVDLALLVWGPTLLITHAALPP